MQVLRKERTPTSGVYYEETSPYLEYQNMTERGGLVQTIGEKNFFWSSDQAIVEAERQKCKFCKNALR